ncbi:Fur family transcriptional regulator [Gulosibacter molinativorax]|uniref:Transcriptional repressor n=1 Tax=Gulosibacter molinativorax TaxID=256821 RepID=A0ABT7C9C1_9MICO|nr:transcriptional repressor [Gulosibacter molinativorax]MDJ1371747.1 transcriptional repressor [Gulosibacter molinativorax]QUY63169.1 Ferric uptake regulator, Fur family [Gulosibacter molinativorax]
MTEGRKATPQRRHTWQREAVRDHLRQRDGFVTAQELHRDIEESGQRIGLATVYRALASLVEAGDADSMLNTDGEQYRFCETEHHHHHLVCRNCGATVEISDPTVEQWAAAVAEQYGYTEVTHTLDVFGLCENCSATGR